MMKLNTLQLGEEPTRLRLELSAGWLAQALGDVLHEDGAGAGRVQITVLLLGEKVHVSGRLSADFPVACSRCLGPASVRVDEPWEVVFEPRTQAPALEADHEIEDDEVDWVPYDDPEIDLAPLIREQILLAVPMAQLCREDCPGLDYEGRPDPEEESVDPRWAALAKLDLKR